MRWILLAAVLLVAGPAWGQWTPSVSTERGLAYYDQDFTYAFGGAGVSTTNQDVTACNKPELSISAPVETIFFDCPNATAGFGSCREVRALPHSEFGQGPIETQFSQGFVKIQVKGAGAVNVTVACKNLVNKTWDGSAWVDTWAAGGSAVPGLTGTQGSGETLTHLFGLQEFASTPGTRYYFSDTGDDANAPCTNEASPCRTLHQADTIIEGTCGVVMVMEGTGSWDTQADYGASFDGSLGPPPVGCGDLESPGAFLISSAAAADPWNIDCTNLTDAQREQDADTRGLIYGWEPAVNEFDNTRWIAVSNLSMDNCPNAVPQTAGSTYFDLTRGNVLTLNVSAPNVVGHNRQFYSGKGSMGIHINPTWSHRDAADFDATCTDVDTPYACCTGLNNCEMNTQFIANSNGGTVLISNKTYQWSNTQPDSNPNKTLLGENKVGDFIVLGPKLEKTVTTDTNSEFGMRADCTRSVDADYVFAYTHISGFNAASDESIFVGATSATCGRDLILYQSLLDQIGYVGIDHGGTVNGYTKDQKLVINCTTVDDQPPSGYAIFINPANTPSGGSLDMLAVDSFMEEMAQLGYVASQTQATHGAIRSRIGQIGGFSCNGDPACASGGWFDRNDGNKPVECTVEQVVMLPEGESGCAESGCLDGWIPAYVAGDTIKSFRFGAQVSRP